MEIAREREIYERFKNFKCLKFILRDSIRQPRLAVKIAHVTSMPTLPSYKKKELVSNVK